jgi:ABC-type branched-subunit amino acid transport system substrate-binding protein
MSKKTIMLVVSIAILAIAVGVILISVANNTPTGKVVQKKVIKIGYIGALSGDATAYGETQLNSIQMALGDNVELVVEDGKCNGKDAATAAQKLVNVDKVDIILGFTCSSELLATAPITEANNVITMSSFASNPDISDIGTHIFRNTPTDLDWAPTATEGMHKDGHRKIALVTENTDFAVGAKKIIKQKFEELGGEVVVDELYSTTEKDFRTQITKIKNSDAEAIFVLPQSDVSGGLVVKQMKELGVELPIYSTYTWTSPVALETAGSASEGVYFFDLPAVDKTNSKATAVMNQYYSEYGEPAHEVLVVLSYDIGTIIQDALKECDYDTANTQCLLDELYSTEDFSGAAGSYHFDNKGDVKGVSFVKRQIVNGQAVLAE